MAPRKFILICQSGGNFVKSKDGLDYIDGEAHAVGVNLDTCYDDLKLELADMCDSDIEAMSIKYFLPGNNRTLITISNDKDLKRMIDFHSDSTTADVYLVPRVRARKHTQKKSIGRRNRLVMADPVDVNASLTTAAPPATAQVVNASPIITAPSTAATVATNNLNSIHAAASPCTSVDAIVPEGPHGPTEVVSTPINASSCANGAVAEDIGNRRRTASGRISSCGFTIGSIRDEHQQQGCSVSSEKDMSNPTSGNMADDFEQRKSNSCGNKLNSDSVSDADVIGQQGIVASWKTGITDVGQNFSDVREFRDVLRKYAIANRFIYKFKKNESDRVSVKCKEDGCSWKIVASWVPSESSLKIKKMHKTHTCGDVCTSVNALATKQWLASLVKDKLQGDPHYSPKEIVSDILQDYGIDLNYWQARRALEMARTQLQGSFKEAYSLLALYNKKVVETNPGSVATFTTKDDLTFQRLFISYHASLHGFQNGCRPILFLEATPLKSRYREILLAATTVDGDDGTFPVAFAVVDIEDDDNWHWFLGQLKSAILKSESITFVYDKRKALSKSINEIFENAHHGYAVHCLVEDFRKDIRGPFHGDRKASLVVNFLTASEALQPDSFRKCIESIKSVSLAAYDWIMSSEPEYWANSQLKGERYNQIKSSNIELFKTWLIEARELPIVEKIDMIRLKMMQLICTRREDCNRWSSTLTPSKEAKLQEESLKALALKVIASSASVFEVHGDHVNVVNIDRGECSCCGWQMSGLPCSHAIAVFNYTGKSPYGYCTKYFLTETFKLTYSESINPVPEVGKCDSMDSSDKVQINPPCPRTHQPESHPKRKQTNSGEVTKRTLHCSKCKGAGHYRSSCKT